MIFRVVIYKLGVQFAQRASLKNGYLCTLQRCDHLVYFQLVKKVVKVLNNRKKEMKST